MCNAETGDIYKEPFPPAMRTYYEALASDECTRRIIAKWPLWAQQNAIDEVYGEEGLTAMQQWRNAHRAAYQMLITRTDLEAIDIKSNEHWPDTLLEL
jgi:hypothetical protein